MILYPFLPKSNRQLLPGQFWGVPLANGRFACGRVLDVPPTSAKDHRHFYAGLLNWTDVQQPDYESIAGAQILEHGFMHIKGIIELKQPIIGFRPLYLDHIVLPLTVESQGWSPNLYVFQGYTPIRNSQREEHPLRIVKNGDTYQSEINPTALPVQAHWGYRVIQLLAEKHFLSAV